MPDRRVVAGNWKMYKGPTATRAFFREFRPPSAERAPTLLVFPPALSVTAAVACPERDPAVAVGVQNIHFEAEGAFTGEVSAAMAADAGATWVLVGHSERRHVFGETDRQVALKVRAAVRAGLTPVLCVGETLEERRAGRVEEVILHQLDAALRGTDEDRGDACLVVAYEPVWAIGTGENAKPDDASTAHALLRARLRERLGKGSAGVSILYGGSVKPGNAAELLAAEHVDGVLVGGASLDPASFARIAEAASR